MQTQDLVQLAGDLGPWVGVAASAALALRSHASARAAEAEAAKLRASSDAVAVAQLREWIEELRRKVRAQAAKITRLDREANGCEMRCAELEEERAELLAKIAGLETRIAELETRVSTTEGQRDALRAELDEHRAAIAAASHLPSPPAVPGELRVLPGLRRKE